jgi:hypothetical protein
MPALKTKMVIPANPVNPQIQKAVDFAIDDIAVPAELALFDLAVSPEGFPQQGFSDDS